jgi:hypothetical protein
LQRRAAEEAEAARLAKVQRVIREIIREIIGEMIRETTIGKRRMSGSAFIASSEDTHSRTT